ncbi:MAG: L-threonylcarbamoyladenylate synthase [Dehalococcoidales bacterium]|nr:L-threonylcarbamoyladenylate synthase [Dehalococcoidales bacterium]
MKTRVLSADDPASIEIAAGVLGDGGLVAFPTDTVYGLGAHAFMPQAVQRIFEVKGRAAEKAIPILLADPGDLPLVAESVSPAAQKLVERFWPGGLTIVLPKSPDVPNVVTSGGSTIAVRVPNHPAALALIRRAGAPLAVTSANRSGRASPKTAEEVRADLEGLIEVILDGGRVPGGRESTVLDLTRPQPTVLRRGAIGVAELEQCLAQEIQEP